MLRGGAIKKQRKLVWSLEVEPWVFRLMFYPSPSVTSPPPLYHLGAKTTFVDSEGGWGWGVTVLGTVGPVLSMCSCLK